MPNPTTDKADHPPFDDLMALPTEDRIQLALAAIARCTAEGKVYSINQAAKDYSVARSILQARVKGVPTCTQAHEHQQKLSPAQENVLAEWIKAQVSLCSDIPFIL